jgi:Uma2 family endonuclease
MAFPVNQTTTLIEYPDTDGLPVAESDFQLMPLLYAVGALGIYFQDRPDVYVAGDLFIYYEAGNPRAVVAPDVCVVLGAARRLRSSYFVWREPKGPDFVLEITSNHTRQQDQEEKPVIYAALGVREYVHYDPTGDYLVPPLQGLQLVGGEYQPMPVVSGAEGMLILRSAELGLELRLSHGELRFVDATTGRVLLSHQEAEHARQEAEQEAAARQAAEARLVELEARVRALQALGSPEQPPPASEETR